MRRLALLLVAACSNDPIHVVGFYSLTDDGTTVQVTGCYDDGSSSFSCAPPPSGVTMTATMDGMVRDLPIGTIAPLDAEPCDFLQLQLTTSFAANFPEPSDPQIDIVFDGERLTTRELPSFVIQAPPDGVHRSAGVVTASYEVLPGADSWPTNAFLTSDCPGASASRCGILLSPDHGALSIDFARADIPADATTCHHTIVVEQGIDHSSRDPVDGWVSRIVRVTFSSVP